jgi:hypothetical protein
MKNIKQNIIINNSNKQNNIAPAAYAINNEQAEKNEQYIRFPR